MRRELTYFSCRTEKQERGVNRRWLFKMRTEDKPTHLDIAPPIRPRDSCALCEVQFLSREGRIEAVLLGDISAITMECNTCKCVHSTRLSHLRIIYV